MVISLINGERESTQDFTTDQLERLFPKGSNMAVNDLWLSV